MLHIADLDLAARWLAARPKREWLALLQALTSRQEKAAAHRKATGRLLAGAGDGSLASAILVDGFPPALQAKERIYLQALAALCFHIAGRRIILSA